MNKLKSKVSFSTENWNWSDVIAYETVVMKDSVRDYISEIFAKQSFPNEYDEVILATVELKHVRKVRKLLSSLIDVYKGKSLEHELTYYEHKLLQMVEESESDFELINSKFNMDHKQTSASMGFLVYYNNKVVKSTAPIKELLQFSDKVKIDKYILMNKVESMENIWKNERPKFKNENKRELDMNARNAYDDDEVLLNEDYEEL
jgi:hypothetical protein